MRYGRVPKRSREICGVGDEPNVRVSTPTTPLTPTTPQMCSIASPPDITPLLQDAELPSTTEMSVYDVILCVSQAHRANCTYTDELTRDITRLPISMPITTIKEECDVCPTIFC